MKKDTITRKRQYLSEIKSYQPYARHVFWTVANPFAMSYENLKLRVCTVRDYLIKCKTIAMFASIRDIRDKEAWQLTKLRAMGIKGRTHLFANTSFNFYLLTAYLPKERKAAASELQYVSDTVSEEEIAAYRRELKEFG